MAPTTGPGCCRNVCRDMQSDIVRSTSGWSWTIGLVSDARDVESSGFSAILTNLFGIECSTLIVTVAV